MQGLTVRLRRLALAAPLVAGVALGLSSPGATRLTAAEAAGAVECFGKAATIESNAEFVPGTDGADVIVTRGNANGIVAFEGRDRACSGRGEDFIRGDLGDDRLNGGRGGDKITGGDLDPDNPSGDDIIRGGPGNDELFGHDGADVIDGGAGTDTCRGGPGKDKLTECER